MKKTGERMSAANEFTDVCSEAQHIYMIDINC
jgi:hypothetical protein